MLAGVSEAVFFFLFSFLRVVPHEPAHSMPHGLTSASARRKRKRGKKKGSVRKKKASKGGQEGTLQNVKDAMADLLFIESDRQAADWHRLKCK